MTDRQRSDDQGVLFAHRGNPKALAHQAELLRINPLFKWPVPILIAKGSRRSKPPRAVIPMHPEDIIADRQRSEDQESLTSFQGNPKTQAMKSEPP